MDWPGCTTCMAVAPAAVVRPITRTLAAKSNKANTEKRRVRIMKTSAFEPGRCQPNVIARTGQPPSLGRPKRCRRQRSSKKNAAPWPAYDPVVIFITAKFRVLAEHADQWAEITREFTEATRAEQGNLWFEWSR